ncbi:MAG: hypothetical protein ABJF10_02820 [Chthoniobacter sp.]|uniref:hypothetical protein n=1 Tax=Chthoniobacter sp. TaxID=2510640 RepID=UPI0032AD00F1
MKRFFLLLASLAAATASFGENGRNKIGDDFSHTIDKANVLPLALDDSFQFRKSIILLNDPQINKPSFDAMINFERSRVNYGALNSYERRARYGHYFKFFWRSNRKTDLTVRFEYRQQNLGAFVQAKEYNYKDAKGSFMSEFDILGDQYIEDGKVCGWRVVLIENGKIVGLNQSFLWN